METKLSSCLGLTSARINGCIPPCLARVLSFQKEFRMLKQMTLHRETNLDYLSQIRVLKRREKWKREQGCSKERLSLVLLVLTMEGAMGQGMLGKARKQTLEISGKAIALLISD